MGKRSEAAGAGWRKDDAEALVCRLIVLGVLREFFQHTVRGGERGGRRERGMAFVQV